MKESTIHGQAYELYSWETLGLAMFGLAKQMLAAQLEFDRVVALAKGGLTFSRSLVDYLAIPKVSTCEIQFYTGIGKTREMPIVTQSLGVPVQGERILVFDDIVDKGTTMEVAADYLQMYGPKHVTTATLVKKPWSTFKVDYAAYESVAWVIFPNETRETITILTKMWQEMGDSASQIKTQLAEVGFSEEEVALFGNLD